MNDIKFKEISYITTPAHNVYSNPWTNTDPDPICEKCGGRGATIVPLFTFLCPFYTSFDVVACSCTKANFPPPYKKLSKEDKEFLNCHTPDTWKTCAKDSIQDKILKSKVVQWYQEKGYKQTSPGVFQIPAKDYDPDLIKKLADLPQVQDELVKQGYWINEPAQKAEK